MFAELRARLKALGEVIDQHMKGDGFPFEKGVRGSLEAIHGTVQELDNRVHALEVRAGIKDDDAKPANVQAELDEAATHEAKRAETSDQDGEDKPAAGEHGKPDGEHSA
jgi:hypothetical protein